MSIGSNNWEGLTLGNGRYKIAAKLGEGGMGFVYRARDQNIEADVVIKVPRQAMMDDPEFVARFTRETRSLVQLSHPHIVKVTDVGTWEGTPFAVMQFLPGGSLEDQRPTGPDGLPLPCDPKKVAGWLVAVAGALDYIHGQRYVHRDVKPANILFDALGHAFLSDFGVAKVLASANQTRGPQTAMTGAGIVLGTPEYMAPELIMGEPFDGRVDQYALAVTVYELLCGRRPFEDSTMTKVLVLHTSKAPPRLTDWCPALPARLSQAVLTGLAKNPDDRYPRCIELAKAVEAAADAVVARDDRVRLKCPGCGKTGSIPAADFAKLKQSRGRATCPACKSPIDISSADSVAPTRSAPGGTMQFSYPGNFGEHSPRKEQGTPSGGVAAPANAGEQAARRTPIAGRGGTMAVSPSGSHPEQPPVSEPPLPASPGTSSGTVMERAGPVPGPYEKSSDVFQSLVTSVPDGLMSPKPKPPATGKLALNQTQLLIAGGVGTAALVAVLFAVFWFAQSPEAEPNPAPVASTGRSPAPVVTKTQGSLSKQSAPPSADTSQAKRVAMAETPGVPPSPPSQPDTEKTRPKVGSDNLATTAASKTEADVRPAPPKAESTGTASHPLSPPPVGIFAAQKFDTARLAKRPKKTEYTLEKILATARSYRDEIVVPAGMYCLTRSSAGNPSGPRKYSVTECSLVEKGARKLLFMTPLGSTDLEVEPRLAEQLENLKSGTWEQSVAILTLWITSSNECGIVRAEILQQCIPGLKPGFGPGQADVDYMVLNVSPDGSKPGKADDADWQTVRRMNKFYQHHKNHVDMLRKNLQNADMNLLAKAMGSMYGDMMKGISVDAMQQRQMQQRLIGR